MSNRKVVSCWVLFASVVLFAQVDTQTSIRGLITDPTGGAIPGANVMIRNAAPGETRSASSDASGAYTFPSVPPGTYVITVTHAGFKRSEIRNRVAQVSEPAQVDIVLQVGEVTESVTVS